jgi:hypothetical protein
MFVSFADYARAEEPTLQVFTEEEIELGDLPEIKKEEQKDTRDAKKAERLAKRQAEVASQELTIDPNDPSKHLFGELELNRSQGDP